MHVNSSFCDASFLFTSSTRRKAKVNLSSPSLPLSLLCEVSLAWGHGRGSTVISLPVPSSFLQAASSSERLLKSHLSIKLELDPCLLLHWDVEQAVRGCEMYAGFVSGPNFKCLMRVQPWPHGPIYSHSQSATCWTQEMPFNPFLHCPKHGQLRDAHTIIRQWAGYATRHTACPDARRLQGPVHRCVQL